MGTQQILMIVLSVIIVGVAVAVGIQMFGTLRDSAGVQAIAADLQGYGAQIVAFEATPTTMGGGAADVTAAVGALGNWMGWGADFITNGNATYTLTGGVAADFVITVSASQSGAGNGSTCTVAQAGTTPSIAILNN